MAIGVEYKILNVAAYIPICSEKVGSHHYMRMRILQFLLWLQGSTLQGFTHGMGTSHALHCNLLQASQLPTCSKITILLAGLLPKPLKGSWHSNHRYSTIALKERFGFWGYLWFRVLWCMEISCHVPYMRLCVLVACAIVAQLQAASAGPYIRSLHQDRLGILLFGRCLQSLVDFA